MEPPQPSPIRLAVADRAFRLTPEERTQVAPGFDVDALERLLRLATPEFRKALLPYFGIGEPDERRGMLQEIHDDELQAILEEVYAPMWERLSPSFLDSDYRMPGREIALRRRGDQVRAQHPSTLDQL